MKPFKDELARYLPIQIEVEEEERRERNEKRWRECWNRILSLVCDALLLAQGKEKRLASKVKRPMR